MRSAHILRLTGLLLFAACGGAGAPGAPAVAECRPAAALAATSVVWSVKGGDTGGTVDATGLYHAPQTPGTYEVVATSARDATRSAAAAVAVNASVSCLAGTRLPVSVAPGSHCLQDCRGLPFRIQGDAAWSLLSNLTLAEARAYLDDRASRGFNAVLVNLVEHKFAANAPANRNGDFPFTAHSAGSYDFTTPNEAYFAFADQVIDYAASKGLVVLLAPMYLGYGGGDEGWWSELTNSVNTRARCNQYGQWVGTRYQGRANVVWVDGGDFAPPSGSEGEARTQQIYAGIRAAAPGQLHTFHWARQSMSTDQAAFASEAQLNAVYVSAMYRSGTPNALGQRAFGRTPAIPAFVIEAYYEGDGSGAPTRAQLRGEGWAADLTAVGGYVYGHGLVWQFATGWQAALSSTGVQDLQKMGAFLDGVAWSTLAPSTTVVSSGGGSEQAGTYVSAAAATDGKLLVAYVPDPHTGAIALQLSALSGPSRARWLDPTSGAFTDVTGGAYSQPASGTQSFTVPGANAAGDHDWVLVLDVK